MRRSVLALAFLCSAGAQAEALALADAVRLAAQRHPDVVAAEKRLAAAEARAEQAHSYRYNPEISYEAQRRRLRDGGRTRDFYLTLAQPLEVGGKRDLRIQKAEAERKAAAAALALARLQAGVRAARAYVQAWHAQQLLRLRKREAALARRLVQAAQKRLALGAGSRHNTRNIRQGFALTYPVGAPLIDRKQKRPFVAGRTGAWCRLL